MMDIHFSKLNVLPLFAFLNNQPLDVSFVFDGIVYILDAFHLSN